MSDLVICLNCTDFSFQRASQENARNGFGCCKHQETFIVFSARLERDCPVFDRATADVIARREKFMRGSK